MMEYLVSHIKSHVGSHVGLQLGFLWFPALGIRRRTQYEISCDRPHTVMSFWVLGKLFLRCNHVCFHIISHLGSHVGLQFRSLYGSPLEIPYRIRHENLPWWIHLGYRKCPHQISCEIPHGITHGLLVRFPIWNALQSLSRNLKWERV